MNLPHIPQAGPVNGADVVKRWPSRSVQARRDADALHAAYRHGLADGLRGGKQRGMARGFFSGAVAALAAVIVGLLISGRLS